MPTITKSEGPQLEYYDVTIDGRDLPPQVATEFQIVYLEGEFKEVLTTIPQAFYGTRGFFTYASRINCAIESIEDSLANEPVQG